MTHEIEDQKMLKEQPNTGRYHAPRLLLYGAVQDLTTSGSVDNPEGTGTGNITKAPQP